MNSRILLIASVLAVASPIHSQSQNKRKFFLDEFQISANRMLPNENSSETGVGYGIGVFHSFRSAKMLNLLLGLEYNRITQFKDFVYSGRFQYFNDMTYMANCISMSFGPRFNIGTHAKLFFDTGIYMDWVVNSHMSGDKDSCYFNAEGLICTPIPISENIDLSNTAGLYLGTGLRIPVSKVELILSADYKYGLNAAYFFYDEAIYHRYFRIKIGMRFN